ncbi:MAG: hypothetical protein HY868_20155 [Chloroflexi bacterium]|nr:hypothetical protein [Chloroflexota bacterium]
MSQIDVLNHNGVRTVRLAEYYTTRRRALETQLGLRAPSLTLDQLRAMNVSLVHARTLLQRILETWSAANWIHRDNAQPIIAELRQQIRDLTRQLDGYQTPTYPLTNSERLVIVEFLLNAMDSLAERNAFVSSTATEHVRTALAVEKENLETKLGRRKPQPMPAPKPLEQPAAPRVAELVPATPTPPAPRVPPAPLRDRFWRTLLSERTLQAMLFLGIFLLFSAAISFVFWGWEGFSAPLRVAIPTAFTLLFLGLGWYVRMQTRMYRSGIALTAIGALLIPIDFYTLYVNFHIPPEHTPAFWFITSLACLAAYIAITFSTGSAFIGYLVGTAAGSTVSALVEIAHQHFALARDWNAAALAALAVVLMLLATAWTRAKPNRWRILAEPFRNLALIAAGAIMLLSFGWRYIDRHTFDALHASMTTSWWLGGFLFGWGAIHYRSRTLGILAALTLPVATFFAQAALFDQTRTSPAWHAFGLAWLTPIYFTAGNQLLARADDTVLRGHGRTATGWGIALTVVAALWSLTNLTSSAAAAASHAVLCAAMFLALMLWRRTRILYAASFFALTTSAFAMTELNLSPHQFAIGWSSLAIVYLVGAVVIGSRARGEFSSRVTTTLVNAGFVIAALALVPPFLPYDGNTLAYALGNWLGLAAWSARLAHTGQPGFGRTRFHWMTALPLPVWILILFANRGPLGYDAPLALSALAWGMVALSYRVAAGGSPARTSEPLAPLKILVARGDLPWYLAGLFVSVLAPMLAFVVARGGYTPALCILAAGALYLADAISKRQRWELLPGALVAAWGWVWLLDHARVSFDAVTFAVTLLIALYVGAGLWYEHRRSRVFTREFLTPLYWASHALALVVLLRATNSPLAQLIYRAAWTDEMRLWQAASFVLLGIVYALYAWNTFQEYWAHAAAWLFIAGGGLVAISYSTGSGSLAARAALGALAYVFTERALFSARRRANLGSPVRAYVWLAWRLYRRPLLVAGWLTSVAVIGVALGRNLILLGGGRTQQIWAVVGLTMIVALYALSARMFRLARFVWFAAFLAFVPWTILTNLGWLVAERPRTAAFAISWMALAWLAYLIGLVVRRFAPVKTMNQATPPNPPLNKGRARVGYALPLRVFAHIVMPFALLWGIADASTSRVTFMLAIVLYALEAIRELRQSQRTAFLYPALGLVPVWCVYLLNLLPGARHEHFGLMLLTFGALGLLAGQSLERVASHVEIARRYGLPAYLTGFVAAMVGTLLVAHDPVLMSLAILYDALLMLVAARLFKNPLWVFVASALAPFSFWLALNQANVPGNRHGWWLIGLAAIYLLSAWTLRRARLAPYSTAPLMLAFALLAFALPPSSQDRVGAFWGYASTAILYALSALWLRQPLLLTPACALIVVPYAVGLLESALTPEYYGLAFFPGALITLAVGWVVDTRLGTWRDFPWREPIRWGVALAERILNWWALPLYALGFGLIAASPFFTQGKPGLAALNCLLAMPFGAWAIYRFRLRVWLIATVLAGHFAVLLYLNDLGWSRYPADLAARFLPVTVLTALLALVIERRRNESPPTRFDVSGAAWSRPLYFIALVDIFAGQTFSSYDANAGAVISLAHAILIAILASFWASRNLPHASAALGVIALVQYMTTQPGTIINAPTPLAQLALAYGLLGYGLAFTRTRREIPAWLTIWETSLQWSGILVSYGVLAFAGILGINLAQWTVRAMLGLPFRQIVDVRVAQMAVNVLALLGLLYVTAAFNHRRLRVGYFAVAMLLCAWMLHAFYVQIWDGTSNVQWYALPAGMYLLGIAFLEWQRGNRNFARWLDYAAVVLMMGSLFWQTLLYGWTFALMLGAEGFAAFWWGSARRLRRFLYAGLMGIVLATVAQLINSLQSVNQWLVFGGIGLVVVILAIVIERKMEDIKAWRQVLETWE